MPNVLKKDKRITIISALAEGMAIRQVDSPLAAVRAAIVSDAKDSKRKGH